MKQYLSIKDKYTDAILFYRMGDFYEMFFEDAETASRELEITLTSRNKKDTQPIPMCGVPARAAQAYIARLIGNGYKVAICDQVEDPATAKGLVKRDVVRVITPGMIIENDLLDEKTNNYLLAVAEKNGVFGLAYLDISTGAFRVMESLEEDAVVEEILRISPREVLIPESQKNAPHFRAIRERFSEKSVSILKDRVFDYTRSRDRLMEQFKTVSLEGFGCEQLKSGVGAAGALMFYVKETQKQPVAHLNMIETYTLDSYLLLDDMSCQNLELLKNIHTGSKQGTLFGIIDQTQTGLGGRLLQEWIRYPLMDAAAIGDRQDAISEACTKTAPCKKIREHMKWVRDLERLNSRLTMGHANARDMIGVKESLQVFPEILKILESLTSELYDFKGEPDTLTRLADHIDRAIREDAPPTIREGGIIRPGYDSELDKLIQMSRDGKGWLARLEVQEKESTGINSLKVRYNKVFGYYIEVPKTHSEKVPPHFIRKQTLVNAERYITDELKNYEEDVLGAEERRASLEFEIFNKIRREIVRNSKQIQQAAQFLARLDCLLGLADIAVRNNYVRPEITTDGRIYIEDGRHPVIEKMITGERFVPNTIEMDNQANQILVLTGPNMAGKSTVLRQVALLVLMAQMGSFVPAAKAQVSITDRIFTRIGALDNLSHGQSTFMVEMQETANILNHATGKSLVILDEIGRGTSTFDGLSIAWAVAEYLHDLDTIGVKTLFATHYHELTDLVVTKARIRNYNIAVKEWNDEIIFLRKLVEGSTNRSYGIQVARLAGIPVQVLERAKKILHKIENGENGLDSLSIYAGEENTEEKKAVQLNLFQKPEHHILDLLKNADIYGMTPLEALNYLAELHERAKSIVT